MALYRDDPLTPQDAVNLEPLRNSHEADQLETELKALFMQMFEAYIRPSERATNTTGTPHLGPFDQVERAVKAEGLSLKRKPDEQSMRYVFRSWRARNPKRGMHMLRTYLQLLFPNAWTMSQLWADPTAPYPTVVSEVEVDGYFLTSRILVRIQAGADSGEVLAVAPAMRSVLSARLLLTVEVISGATQDIAMAPALYHGAVCQVFEGTFV